MKVSIGTTKKCIYFFLVSDLVVTTKDIDGYN